MLRPKSEGQRYILVIVGVICLMSIAASFSLSQDSVFSAMFHRSKKMSVLSKDRRQHQIASSPQQIEEGVPAAVPFEEDYASAEDEDATTESVSDPASAVVEALPLQLSDDGQQEDDEEASAGMTAIQDLATSSEEQQQSEPEVMDAKLQAKYRVSDEARRQCINKLTDASSSSPWRSSKNIHDRLQARIEDLAISSACSTSRRYGISSMPHFGGGRKQFVSYFEKHGWINRRAPRTSSSSSSSSSSDEGEDGDEAKEPPSVAFISSCLYNLPFRDMARKYEVVSPTPYERNSALKIPLFKQILTLFKSLNCDYRSFHPESFLVDDLDQCMELKNAIETYAKADARKSISKRNMWFFKDKYVWFWHVLW
jgi:hypothetical protein